MNDADVIKYLVGLVGVLVGVLGSIHLWELRRIRKLIHRYNNWFTAVFAFNHLVARKLDLPWRDPHAHNDD